MGYLRVTTPDLGRIFRGETVTGLSDWQLLERYLELRDEVAFEALVARHGPMVLGACRRMLKNQTDVEDAFQATFLVLVRRARHLGPRDAIGPWLHGVATRVALRARCEAARRRRVEPTAPEFAAVIDDRSVADREIAEVIDQELGRLPSKYRHPIVLCYLEGQTHEEAARQLKWPIGTVKGRLSRARDLLQSRLVRRGLAPTVGALSFALSPDVSAARYHALFARTVRSSLKLTLGQATAQITSASITFLVEGVLTSMFLNSLKWAGVAILVGGLTFTGIGVMARQDAKPRNEIALPEAKPATEPGNQAPEAVPAKEIESLKAENDDSPARLAELRRAWLSAANSEWQQAYQEYMSTNKGLDAAYQASKRLTAAQQECAETAVDNLAAAQAQVKRVRSLARAKQNVSASQSDMSSAQVRTYAAEAELLLAQAETNSSQNETESGAGPGNKVGRGKDVKSQLVLAALDKPISMPFTEDTPLEEVIKYIRQSTTTSTYRGIQIYVDPLGLQEADKSMASTVRGIDLEGIPLRRTLQLILKQLDLIYFIEDGVLCITAAGSEGEFGPAIHEPTPIMQEVEKAERGELSLEEMKDLIEVFKTRAQIKRLAAGDDEEPKTGGGGFGGEFGAKRPPARTEEPPKQDAAGEKKESDDSKQIHEQINLLLKEMRGLIEVLKAGQNPRTAAGLR